MNEARYIRIFFPYREKFSSYTFILGNAEQRPLVCSGYWLGTVDLQTHKLLEWKPDWGMCYFQAKVRDEGGYTLLDEGKQPICTLKGYVPNDIIPPEDGAGDYIRFTIDADGIIEEWHDTYDLAEFKKRATSAIIADPDGNLIELSSFATSKKPERKKKYTLEEKRRKHANAYMPWEKEADEYLARLFDEGKTIRELAEIFERNDGGIRSRLKKLGKIEE